MDISRFINKYEKYYFNDCTDKNNPIVARFRTSPYVEKRIEKILLNGLEKEELVLMFAWKIGAICHRPSETEQKIVYSKNFDKTLKYAPYSGLVDYSPYLIYLKDNFNNLKNLSHTPEQLYYELYRNRTHGVGHVYTINTLYFFTHGLMPIYDKFADFGLLGFEKSGDLTEKDIEYVQGYNSPSGRPKVLWEHYMKYVDRLQNAFGKYYLNRAVDRSLWVYGHSIAKQCNSSPKKCI